MPSPMNRLRAFFPLLALVTIGIVMLASGALRHFDPHHIAAEQASLKALIGAHPVLAGLAQVALVMAAIATGLPGALVIVLAGGMLFGIVVGTLLSSIGTTLGALVLFLASRSAFSEGGGSAPALVERLRSGYRSHPASYALFLRLVPFFPYGAVTVALAWLRCPLWLFLLTSAVGGSVMIGFETALGAGLTETIAIQGGVTPSLFTQPRVLLPVLGMALLALLPVVLGRLRGAGARGEGRGASD